MNDDPLLSVFEVARLWGTGLAVVLAAVDDGRLWSLDHGRLIAEGNYDIPLIRRSWAESLQRDSEGASRRLDSGGSSHAATLVAFEFHKALDTGDADLIYQASSDASRRNRTPEQLFREWQAKASHLVVPGSGIGSAVYSLAPIDAVAARVFADAPALPRAVTEPTPVSLIDAFPLVRDGDRWGVDLDLFDRRDEWIPLLETPLPQPEEPS